MLRKIPYKWLVATAFVMALFMEILDMTVLNTALPILGEHFGAETSELQWLVTGYLVSLAVFIPASGWVADRFGDKRTFVLALAIYTGASLWAGLAGSVTELLVARVTQGVGGGLLTPVGTAMLFRAFPPHERARASAVLAIPTTLAPALGPVLGGWLADNVSWRWVFLLKVPVGIVGLIFSAVALRPGERTARERLDVLGFLTGGAGLATLLVGLERGAREGWSDQASLLLVTAGAALIAAFVVTERRVAAPMIDLQLLRNRMFRLGNLILMPAAAATMGALFVVPLMVQTTMGLTATESGLLTMFQAFGMLVMLPFTNRVFQQVGPRRMLAGGFAVITVSQVMLALVDAGSSLWLIRSSMFLMGMAGAFIMVPVQAAAFSSITPQETARASALFSTARQVAASLGVALLATTLTVRMTSHLESLASTAGEAARAAAAFDAYQDVFLVAAAVAVLGVIVSFRVRDEEAAASRGKPAPEPAPTTLEAAEVTP
ncbi:EmrB/QacA subfamily drug resistance transporter [Barrientosiimonas humi]|uniref:EmrB/QacA subfamily drug resistance transporter n=1 Tax=Barrientosiimonas humi TaxID=999931 RepID=A0A542XAK0_9MICO|nr:MDR family MFS transporter [Barrientosiimonas humi]TQL32857.1 EmrB/QacA subfamily drug resistance transporter [Barrientosiimonas humi]CAG7572848.1 putative transport protein HsrA [Barrientosiimonas humi]